MLCLEEPGTFSEAPPGVLATVPFMGADVRKEILHRNVVVQEQLAVEMSGVPFDQYPAQIEHDDTPARPRHLPDLDIEHALER
jgi:hypothetical protein